MLQQRNAARGSSVHTRETLVFRRRAVQDNHNPSQCGDRQGTRDELITRLAARTGIDRVSAEQSIGVIHILPP